MSTLKLRRRRLTIAAGLATLAMTMGLAAVPAEAVVKTSYVALGDSYAAGQGAGPYLDPCYRSDHSYAQLANQEKGVKLITNAACSGKTTGEVVATQLGRLSKSTELVTITAGGNDLNVGNIMILCSAGLGTPACAGAVTAAQTKILNGTLATDVGNMILAVKAKAPNAKIVVTGYPYLFTGDNDFEAAANALLDGLNGSIQGAAYAGGANIAQYVDVRAAFAGHGVDSAAAWINFNPAGPLSPDDFHPNAAGYVAYYTALSAAGVYAAV